LIINRAPTGAPLSEIDAMQYAIKFEPTRPAGNYRDVIRLRRQWALVRRAGIGYAVLGRYATKDSALRALATLTR
jgi:hypothetical protein